MPGLEGNWTTGWPADRIRTAGSRGLALAVIGDCGAADRQLEEALGKVREKDWRALTRWPGSYLTLARHGETLAVIGDLAGQHPLYFRQHAHGTWWSTAATALAALDKAPLDTTALAAHLALAQPDVLATRSLFRTIERVPTGHLLLITAAGASTERYEPADHPPQNLREMAPTVRAALTEAVETRLHGGPVSSDLAGLDSTTLACLAAKRTPVTAVTFTDQRMRDDDLTYAARTAATVPGLTHHTAPGTPATVYYSRLDPRLLPFTDAPNAYSVTAAIKRTVLETVTAHHPAPGVHLTGSAGDAVLSAPSTYLADLLRDHRYRRAWQHAAAHARLRRTSAGKMLTRARPASRTSLREAWQQLAANLRQPPRAWMPQANRPLAWTPLLASADWMHPDMRAQLADAVTHSAVQLDQEPASLASWNDRQDLVRVGADVTGWREIALTEYGTELAAPYLDNEVIRACLTVPADQRGTAGHYKPLLTQAFTHTGVLPDFVLTRGTKGGFNALSYAGLREHASALTELLGPSSRLAAAGLITEGPVHTMLERAAAGQPTAQGALHLATAVEIWLRQLETAPARWEVTNRVATA